MPSAARLAVMGPDKKVTSKTPFGNLPNLYRCSLLDSETLSLFGASLYLYIAAYRLRSLCPLPSSRSPRPSPSAPGPPVFSILPHFSLFPPTAVLVSRLVFCPIQRVHP